MAEEKNIVVENQKPVIEFTEADYNPSEIESEKPVEVKTETPVENFSVPEISETSETKEVIFNEVLDDSGEPSGLFTVETVEEEKEKPKIETVTQPTALKIATPKIPVSTIKKPEPLFSKEAEKFYNMKDRDGLSVRDFFAVWIMQKAKENLHRTIEIFDMEKFIQSDEKAPSQKCFIEDCKNVPVPRILSIIDTNNGRILKQETNDYGEVYSNKKGSFVKRLTKDENGNLKAVPAIGCGNPYKKGSHFWQIRNIKYYDDAGKPVYFTDGRTGKPRPLKMQTYVECLQDCEEQNGELARKKYAAENHRKSFNKTFAAPEKRENSGGYRGGRNSGSYKQDSTGGYTKKTSDGKEVWSNHSAKKLN